MSSARSSAEVPLQPQTTAAFYGQVMEALQRLDLDVAINRRPNEVEPAIPFDEDEVHSSYDPEWAYRFWRALLQARPGLDNFLQNADDLI